MRMAASCGHALQLSSLPRGALKGGRCDVWISVSTGIREMVTKDCRSCGTGRRAEGGCAPHLLLFAARRPVPHERQSFVTISLMPVETEIQTSHLPPLRAPRGSELSCKAWPQEAAMRMLMNNLDEEVAERPRDLVVYGGTGKAARNQQSLEAILASLKSLANDETLLVQSGKPVGIFKTHDYAPRVLIANSNLVGHWSNWDKFNELERAGLMMYGQMTAGSWIYIPSQAIIHEP